MKNKLAREVTWVFVILFLIIASIALFFFLTDGQINGVNYNPEMVLQSTDESNVNGLSWEVIDEDFDAIDDSVGIIPVELWQLPPRDILIRIITKPMAYIPPAFSHLLSIIYLALGLSLFVLYRQRVQKTERAPDSRCEIIYQTIAAQPGISQQMIVDKTGFSRGSVRHHINALLRNQEIVTADIEGHARYIVQKTNIDSKEQMIFISLLDKKNVAVLIELHKRSDLGISELADAVGHKPNALRWRMKRLEESGIVQSTEGKGCVTYRLDEAVKCKIEDLHDNLLNLSSNK